MTAQEANDIALKVNPNYKEEQEAKAKERLEAELEGIYASISDAAGKGLYQLGTIDISKEAEEKLLNNGYTIQIIHIKHGKIVNIYW